jgi:hypothetical protein
LGERREESKCRTVPFGNKERKGIRALKTSRGGAETRRLNAKGVEQGKTKSEK